jgi:hypothetical protein
MRSLIAGCIVVAFTSVAALANPAGKYDVSGTNPNGAKYSGSVTIQKTGDTFKVTWTVGDQHYDGTGIGNNQFVAVSYQSGRETGLALYSLQDDEWKGVWTYAGGKQLGTEVWTRK